jgi:hypothetical protein
MKRAARVFAVAIVAFASVPSAAQCLGGFSALDPGNGSSTDEPYTMVTWDPDGPGPSPELLVVGGNFQSVGGIPAVDLATWNGTSWQPFPAAWTHTINALTVYNGQLIAGGELNQTIGNIGVWNGSSWGTGGFPTVLLPQRSHPLHRAVTWTAGFSRLDVVTLRRIPSRAG